MTTQISSDELHMLVYRFLQESGFEHSAYVFATESMLGNSPAATAEIPCGALISFLHKGLLFSQLEKEIEAPKKLRLTQPTSHSTAAASDNADVSQVIVLKGHAGEVFACAFSTREGNLIASGSRDSFGRVWKLDADGNADCRLLEHQTSAKSGISESISNETGEKSAAHDVTTVAWSPNGETLATACLDGKIRLWTKDGVYLNSLSQHQGPVFSIKWSSHGKRILSGGQDKTTIVWDISSLTVVKSFQHHQMQTLDVDWCPGSGSSTEDDEDVFASCSSDRSIVVCRVSTGEANTLSGHEDDVNAVKWSPDGKLLASCSDDTTAKIWSAAAMKQANPIFVDLRGHTKEVYTIEWSPTGPGSPNPNRPRRIATGSFDTTVKIWDPETGQIQHTLAKQTESVYAIEFDPSGEHLLSGSFDGLVNVWSVDTGSLLKSLKVGAGVFDVSWNLRGDKFAASSSDGTITVVDF